MGRSILVKEGYRCSPPNASHLPEAAVPRGAWPRPEVRPGYRCRQGSEHDPWYILRSLVSRAGAGGQRVVLRFVLKEYANSMKSTITDLHESARQTGNTGSSS